MIQYHSCSFGEQVQENNTELLPQIHGWISCNVYERTDAGDNTDCGFFSYYWFMHVCACVEICSVSRG